jgi:hypothetical protein
MGSCTSGRVGTTGNTPPVARRRPAASRRVAGRKATARRLASRLSSPSPPPRLLPPASQVRPLPFRGAPPGFPPRRDPGAEGARVALWGRSVERLPARARERPWQPALRRVAAPARYVPQAERAQQVSALVSGPPVAGLGGASPRAPVAVREESSRARIFPGAMRVDSQALPPGAAGRLWPEQREPCRVRTWPGCRPRWGRTSPWGPRVGLRAGAA